MKIEIPAAAQEIIKKLNDRGYEAYLVGGCVRDMLLGRQPGDWDITTSALPEQVKEVFRRTVDTGIQHGTVTVLMGKCGYEVTTYRIDGEYSDGRHPDKVAFTPSLLEDLKRRDFTVNAMAYNEETGIVDAFGGMDDLNKGIIRCVGEPMDRFTEDALRILRAIRFSAQLGFEIEERTSQAVKIIAPNLVHVSKERIQVELTKLLLSPNPQCMSLVYETGISAYVSDAFQKVESLGLPQVPVTVPAIKHMRWAAFLRVCGPGEAAAVLKGLKLDNDTIYRVKTLVEWVKCPLTADSPVASEKNAGTEENDRETAEKTVLRRAMSCMEPQLFDDLLTLKKCLAGNEPGDSFGVPETKKELEHIDVLTEEIRENGDCVSLKTLAVTGNDVIQAGVKPGKEVGQVLSKLLDLVLEAPERNTKEELLALVKSGHCRKEQPECTP